MNFATLVMVSIPIVLAVIALAVAWGSLLTRISVMRKSLHDMPGRFAKIQADILKDQTELAKDIVALEKKMNDIHKVREQLKKEYLLKTEHTLLCSNAVLRIEAHITGVVSAMQKTILREIKALIKP